MKFNNATPKIVLTKPDFIKFFLPKARIKGTIKGEMKYKVQKNKVAVFSGSLNKVVMKIKTACTVAII